MSNENLIKYIFLIVIIPLLVLLFTDFEMRGFLFSGFYLLVYFAHFHPESMTPEEKTRVKKEKQRIKEIQNENWLKQRREVGYQKWLNEKRGVKNMKPMTLENSNITPVKSKYSLSEEEFENEINDQFNQLTGTDTKILWVGDEHRRHPWSLQPGGCTVVVLFTNRKCLGYDKVKRPDRYTRKIASDFVSNHYSNARIGTLESYISEIYLTSDRGIDLRKVWHSNMNAEPWQVLSKYRTR